METLFKYASLALFFAALWLVMRFLLGPRGLFRDKQWDEDDREMVRRERRELEGRLERGEISRERYEWEKKRL